MKRYSQRFHMLLHLEEIQMEEDIKKYDLYEQILTRDRNNKSLLVLHVSFHVSNYQRLECFIYSNAHWSHMSIIFILQVPGVAEKRPSVLRGDQLTVCLSDDVSQPITMYKGYVHHVELDKVQMGFSKKYEDFKMIFSYTSFCYFLLLKLHFLISDYRLVQRFIDNIKVDVEFSYNRFSIKMQHRAVELAAQHKLGNVLFPSDNGVQQAALPQLRSAHTYTHARVYIFTH